MKKRIVITSNREMYEKLNMLNFSSEVIIKNVKPIQVTKILGNINKKDNILHVEKIGNYFLIKKIGNINFNVYLK